MRHQLVAETVVLMLWHHDLIIFSAAVTVAPAQHAGNDLIIEDTHEYFSLRRPAGERDIAAGRIPWSRKAASLPTIDHAILVAVTYGAD